MQDEDSLRYNLPYRPGIGMMIINKKKEVFVAKRIDTKMQAWQMPQGGINLGETPSKAAFREMQEEIGTSNAKILAESKIWYSYDIPKFLINKLWDGQYRGQKQKWFLMEFEGKDSDINVATNNPEFSDWKWTNIQELQDVIVPFKKKLYKAVVNEFKSFFTII